MLYQVAAIFQKESDEVYIDTYIENSFGVALLPDSVEISLQHETRDLTGLVRYLTVDRVEVDSSYASPDKHLIVRFKNPSQKLNLWVEVVFKEGASQTTKRAFVGTPDTPQVTMDLPSNTLFGVEIEDPYFNLNGGGQDFLPDNEVVLAEEIRNSVYEYDFTGNDPLVDFTSLQYFGGGNRLLTHQGTNRFIKQEEDQPAWEIPAFCFLEGTSENLVDTTFSDWEITTDALIQSNIAINSALSDSQPTWKIRARQTTKGFSNKYLVLETIPSFAVNALTEYSFSTYVQMVAKTKGTKVSSLILTVAWYDSDNLLISESQQTFPTSEFKTLNLAAKSFQSPVGASTAKAYIKFGMLDYGSDIEVSIFSPQVEEGLVPTSRMIGIREADSILTPEINLEHFKLRTVFVPGFSHDVMTWRLVNGFMQVLFSENNLRIVLGGNLTVLDIPFEYTAFDTVDVVFEVKSGDHLKVYRNGVFLDQASVPSYSEGTGTLEVQGTGIELNKLLVFTWS